MNCRGGGSGGGGSGYLEIIQFIDRIQIKRFHLHTPYGAFDMRALSSHSRVVCRWYRVFCSSIFLVGPSQKKPFLTLRKWKMVFLFNKKTSFILFVLPRCMFVWNMDPFKQTMPSLLLHITNTSLSSLLSFLRVFPFLLIATQPWTIFVI